MDILNNNSLNSEINIFTTGTHMDQIYTYSGQTYGSVEADVLKYINRLSRTNQLHLFKRHTTNRNLRILFPFRNENNSFEIKNYQKFINHFNNIALACYLKALKASKNLWNSFSLDETIESNTYFKSFRSNHEQEKRLDKLMQDEEFIKNYLNSIIKIHNQIVKKLNTIFMNNNAKNRHNLNEKNSSQSDRHLYRSFRILGLRKPKNLFKKTNHTRNKNMHNYQSANLSKNFYVENEFNDIVDIQTTFEIKEYKDRSGYDCSIECEFSYFKVKLEETFHETKNESNNLNQKFVNFNLNENVNTKSANLNFNKLNLGKKLNQSFYYSNRDLDILVRKNQVSV